jgi:hypothetical protein
MYLSRLARDEALVVFLRELGIDWKPHDLVSVVGSAGKVDAEFHAVGTAGFRCDVFGELRRTENLFEQGLQLNLTPRAADLHVGQHTLEIAHSAGQRLHLAEPLVDLLEPVAHLFKGFSKPAFKRSLKFLVDGFAHLVEALRVVLLKLTELILDRFSELVEPLLVRLREQSELF